MPEPGLLIVEAPMGEGKTEAALAAAEIMASRWEAGGVLMALPTQATTDAMFGRVVGWLDAMGSGEQRVSGSIMLGHGRARFNRLYQGLAQTTRFTQIGRDEDPGRGPRQAVVAHAWLSGRQKALLANFAVVTIDQLLFAGLKSRHLVLRHLALAGPYITRGTRNVWSAWIPLGDVPQSNGPIMVLERSHLHEQLRNTYGKRDADREKMGWLSDDPVGLRERLGGRWLSTDFEAGDVLLFGPDLEHASLDNNSPDGRCQLSSDTRYQLASDPLDERYNGEDTSNPHGGAPRVILPGKAPGNNEDFQDEWKPVDERGRLLRTNGTAAE